jgi:hypothetical protein
VEAGSNTSTVTLRVVGYDERGSLKSETVKYGREPQGTRTQERLRWQGPAAYAMTDRQSQCDLVLDFDILVRVVNTKGPTVKRLVQHFVLYYVEL